MVYIDAIKGSLASFIIFFLISFLIPSYGSSGEIEIVLTVSTFIFAIIAGFYLSRLNSRYDKIREVISAEDSYWFSFFKDAKFFGKKFSDRIRESIDKYYIVCYDHLELSHYEPTSKHFDAVYEDLDSVKNSKVGNLGEVFSNMLTLLSSIENSRNMTSTAISES